MKSFTAFETAVIGFFTGVIVAAYAAFAVSTGRYLGPVLDWISMRPVLKMFPVPDDQLLVVGFLLTIAIFTLYGALAGIIFKKGGKVGYAATALVAALAIAAIFQQGSGSIAPAAETAAVGLIPQIISRPIEKTAEKYFGNEAVGDLNGDGRDDVAFMLLRDDPSRGTLYYLAAALATDDGHAGTNLIYLGDQAEPKTMAIENGIVTIAYLDHTDKKTKYFYARVTAGNLGQVMVKDRTDPLAWGEVTSVGESLQFQACGADSGLPIFASSTIFDAISAAIVQTASSSVQTTAILGAFIGKTTMIAPKAVGEDKKQAFLVTDVVDLDPKNPCPQPK